MVLDENFKEFIKLLNVNEVKDDVNNLIISKRQAGRLKDLADIEALEKKEKKRK